MGAFLSEDLPMSQSPCSPQSAAELRNIPLRDVLAWNGLPVKPEGVSYRARDERHNIVATGSRWFDNKTGIGGGGAIDLCQHLTGADFPTACRILAEEVTSHSVRRGVELHSHPALHRAEPVHVPFLELASRYARRDESIWPAARNYLVETRTIDAGIVDRLHAVGSIYANDHRPNPSLVFLHRTACGRVEGATLRDTRDNSKFRPCLGDKLNSWFAVGSLGSAKTIVAVESPIDALSYYSLFVGRDSTVTVASCAGAVVPTELMWQAYERRQAFVVALDNDAAGERGWQKAWDETCDWTGFKISSDCPKRKDWNDELQALAHRQRARQATPAPALRL